jgi:excisionase family DNA binding protein
MNDNDREKKTNGRVLLTYAQAATQLGLKPGTLYSMVSRKEIPHIRLGPRLVRFDEDDLCRWIESCRVSREEQAQAR